MRCGPMRPWRRISISCSRSFRCWPAWANCRPAQAWRSCRNQPAACMPTSKPTYRWPASSTRPPKRSLEKQIAEKKKHLQGIEAKLKNASFVDKAPPEVVQQQRDMVAELQSQIKVMEENLRELGTVDSAAQ